jgi:hypothetical protein
MSKNKEKLEVSKLDENTVAQLRDILETEALQRERKFRKQLERAVEVLEQTRSAFRSKQLKELREEIQNILKSN